MKALLKKIRKLLRDRRTRQFLTVPYHLFDTEGEDSSITIRLARQIRDGEEDDLVGHSPTDKTFTVGNIAGAALPQSGGQGTTLLYLLGIMITALAGAGMLMKRRKKRAV